MAGAVGHRAGLATEEQVARRYERAGGEVVARRWRGQAGEIDLVVRLAGGLVFVEVKKARDLARAAERVTPRQAARLMAAAEEYVAGAPVEMRLDVALVDAEGRIQILENAIWG
ncbi:YraN family protein [Rhodobacteraceae bacterium MCCB 386]|nr:YraN family protein [Roseitranquillus sediminis]